MNFEIEISGGGEKIYKVEIRAFVDYQYLKNGNNITPNIHKNQNDWWLVTSVIGGVFILL
ncbi:hypothetical protein UXU46_00125 (plasmid) [Campylobacter jejuni]